MSWAVAEKQGYNVIIIIITRMICFLTATSNIRASEEKNARGRQTGKVQQCCICSLGRDVLTQQVSELCLLPVAVLGALSGMEASCQRKGLAGQTHARNCYSLSSNARG